MCLLFPLRSPLWSLSPSRTFNPSPKQSPGLTQTPSYGSARTEGFLQQSPSLGSPFSAPKHCGSSLSLSPKPSLHPKPRRSPGRTRTSIHRSRAKAARTKSFRQPSPFPVSPFAAPQTWGSAFSLSKTPARAPNPNLTLGKATAKPGKDPRALCRAAGPITGPSKAC